MASNEQYLYFSDFKDGSQKAARTSEIISFHEIPEYEGLSTLIYVKSYLTVQTGRLQTKVPLLFILHILHARGNSTVIHLDEEYQKHLDSGKTLPTDV